MIVCNKCQNYKHKCTCEYNGQQGAPLYEAKVVKQECKEIEPSETKEEVIIEQEETKPLEAKEEEPEQEEIKDSETNEEKVEPEEEVINEPEQIDFSKMKVSELEQYCRENDISGYSDKKKADIIELIKKSGH